jgi:plasmid stability protein
MGLILNIPDDVVQRLRVEAEASGTAPEDVALDAIRQRLGMRGIHDLLGPVREAFAASGMTEDQAVDLFETEKHALRRQPRRAPG